MAMELASYFVKRGFVIKRAATLLAATPAEITDVASTLPVEAVDSAEIPASKLAMNGDVPGGLESLTESSSTVCETPGCGKGCGFIR